MDNFKSRKFILFVIASAVITVALFVGKISGTEFVAGLGAFYTLFVIGNVGEKKIENDFFKKD